MNSDSTPTGTPVDRLVIRLRDGDRVADEQTRRELREAADLLEAMENELQSVTDMVDDILYDPRFKPVDEDGNRITGADLYLFDHPVQEHHIPAIRQWFVGRAC